MKNFNELPPIEDLIRNECPCDKCEKFDFCKYHEMACRSFAKFVFDNSYYKDSARHPTRGMYNKIFNGSDEKALKMLLKKLEETGEDFIEDNPGE